MGGPLFYDFDDAVAVLECYRSYIREAPEPLGCFFGAAQVGNTEANITWVKDCYAAIHPHSGSEGGYINFMFGDDDHRNQNIVPAKRS